MNGSLGTEPAQPDLGTLPISYAIVGVQKAATSTLSAMLTRHRQIIRSARKELHFFDDETRDWERPEYSDYRIPIRRPRQRIVGDATPIYLFWPHSLERMRAYDPNMKLIASFRDPIERAFSQWAMERRRDETFPDFGTVVRDERFQSVPDRFPTDVSDFELRTRTLLPRGLYGYQLRRGYDLFAPDQWLCLDFRTFLADPNATLDQIVAFLGLGPFHRYPKVVNPNPTQAQHVGVAPSGADVTRLTEYYAEDLAKFAELSKLDISAWPTPRVLAGELDPAAFAEKLALRAGLRPDMRP